MTGSAASAQNSVWKAFEVIPHQSAVAATWQAQLRDFFPAFAAAFLQRKRSLARSFPCPRGCGCAHEVVPDGPGKYLALCRCEPCRCPDLGLGSEDVVVWELSWARLGRALCRCLELDVKPAPLALEHASQVGSWSANATPVILTFPANSREFRAVVAELVARLPHGFILFAPSGRWLNAAVSELLAKAGAEFFPLETTVSFQPGGGLSALRSPGELFARFQPEPGGSAEEETVRKAFGLVKALDAEGNMQAPSPLAVFRQYCIEGLSAAETARKLHCAKITVMRRLKLIRTRTGVAPIALRRLSPHLAKMEDELADPRAARVRGRNRIYDDAQ